MRQRGRKPASASVVVIRGGFASRPEPPEELTERQAEIWRAVTATENPDFFSTGALRGLLGDYCRRRESADNISRIIDEFKPEWLKTGDGVKRLGLLLGMRDLESRGAMALLVKLRLTNQSRYGPRAAATAHRNEPAVKPWEV